MNRSGMGWVEDRGVRFPRLPDFPAASRAFPVPIVVFGLGDALLALHRLDCKEVIAARPLEPCLGDPLIEGVAAWEEEPLTVLDLAGALGLQGNSWGLQSRLIVLERPHARYGHLAITADFVLGRFQVSATKIADPTMKEKDRGIAGLFHLDGKPVFVPDWMGLLNKAETPRGQA